MSEYLQIDGSQGEGGGQILRSALALSVLLGKPFKLSSIRAGRSKPGLMRQHLACVLAAKQMSAATVEGAELGSTTLHFSPHTLVGGSHHFQIGSAGSTMLLLQTLLPMMLCAPAETRIAVEGGTHNPMAPSGDFLQTCFLPILRAMGAELSLDVEHPGFFPVGCGKVVMSARPSALRALALNERGAATGFGSRAIVVGLAENIARRELAAVTEHYRLRPDQLVCESFPAKMGCCNLLTLSARFEQVSEVVTVFGERGLPAEQVSARACAELDRYLKQPGAVGEHLADQLLLPFWLAGGGEFTTVEPSLHLRTNADVLAAFGAAHTQLIEEKSRWRVIVKSAQMPSPM